MKYRSCRRSARPPPAAHKRFECKYQNRSSDHSGRGPSSRCATRHGAERGSEGGRWGAHACVPDARSTHDAGAREARRGREADAGAREARATALLWRARRSERMQGHADDDPSFIVLTETAGAREARRGREADAGARATALLWHARRSEQMQGHARRGEGARQMQGRGAARAPARTTRVCVFLWCILRGL